MLDALTQTCPVPPGTEYGAGAGEVAGAAEVGIGVGADAVTPGCTAGVEAAAGANESTPPWREQAPRRELPVKVVPSLQLAVISAV